MSLHRVAITGLGIVSSLGNSVDEVRASLQAGRSGVELMPERETLGFRSRLAGTIKNFIPETFDREHERHLGDGGRLAMSAVMQAVRDADLSPERLRSDRCGAIVGNCGNMRDIYQFNHTRLELKKKLPALALARSMNSTVSANINVILGVRGQCYTVCAACASGAMAIGLAAQSIRAGMQDRMIAGAIQEGSTEFDLLFEALRVFSHREDSPTAASRPFDRRRDGLVPSAGAGFVILENYEQAVARGIPIHGEIIGFASNSDGYSMTTPSGEGSLRCMRMGLADAAMTPDAVDYINAHATSTQVGDAVEAQGIREVFGSRPFVSSTKSMTGHETAASGATELIYTLLMMRHNFVAPSINIEEIDPECAGINLVKNQAIETPLRVAVSNSFGFGGVNNVLVVARPDRSA